jgi:hypothetical protein
MPTREEEIAWAAGLFEGEGTITASNEQFVVRLVNTDEAIVRRLADIVPFGTIYGPYNRQERDGFRRKPIWVWIAARENGLDALALMWPWLSDRRRKRALELTGISFHVFCQVARTLRALRSASRLPPPPGAAA